MLLWLQDREDVNSVQRELKRRKEDEKNTYQERTGNNVQPKQSEEGVECDENNQAGSQAKPSEEQVGCLQGKELVYTISMQTMR